MGYSSPPPPRAAYPVSNHKLKPTEIASRRSSPGRWAGVERHPGTKIWTDDYSSLLSIIKWH